MMDNASVVHAESSKISDQRSEARPSRRSNHDATGSEHSSPRTSYHKLQQQKPICRYYLTKAGCRAGTQCRFQHVEPNEISQSAENSNFASGVATENATITPRHTPERKMPIVRQAPVSKPVPQAQLDDPRDFEISQVIRRYRPFRADLDDFTTLKFRLNPTDPDFPFELESGLHCVLTIPPGYPHNGESRLHIENPEMERGFQINVEKGFDELVSKTPKKTLLELLNALDRNLEGYLTSSKATTVKIVANRRQHQSPIAEPETQRVDNFEIPAFVRYNALQLQEAGLRRATELRQLEARLGRSDLFSNTGDGVAFNIPLQIGSNSNVPVTLRTVRDTALIVPEVYPLEPCTIVLKGVNGQDAENVEVAFEKRVVDRPDLTLMAHINYLTQNIGKLSVNLRKRIPEDDNPHTYNDTADIETESHRRPAEGEIYDPLRPHLRLVARPPEWVHNSQQRVNDVDTSDYDSLTDSDGDPESTPGGTDLPIMDTVIEKGIQLSFPGLNLVGVELLQVSKISVSVKCDRCKEPADIMGLEPSTSVRKIARSNPCQKCSAMLVIRYRPDLMHINSTKAGSLDVENCSIVSMLPSTFQPTCSECSETFPSSPGVTAAPGDNKTTNCRSCYSRMNFTIPEVKFLRISSSSATLSLPILSRKPKEKLGISAGTPLPKNGRCEHYSKSYRWFRFSCCNKVFPCDKCHDLPAFNSMQKENPHPNEHAERMICGWCSREQRYHPESCRMCGQSVVKKSVTTNFWEGGQGQRDKNLMSRKEGRKFKVSGKEKKELESVKRGKVDKGKGGMWWPA